jgi:hypothetical protein
MAVAGKSQRVIRQPTRHHHGLARNTTHFVEETKVTKHGTSRPDGCTYYTCFALNGVIYKHEELVLIGCNDDTPTSCKITSLWEDADGNNMIELQQLEDDEDDERDEVAIEDLVSISKVSNAATDEGGPSSSALPLPAAASSSAASGGVQVVPRRITRSRSNDSDAAFDATLHAAFDAQLHAHARLHDEYQKKNNPGYGTDISILSIRHYEGHLVGSDWTVNQWRRDGPGHVPGDHLALRNVDNGYRIQSYSEWKVTPHCNMSYDDLAKVERERQAWIEKKREKEQKEREFNESLRSRFAEDFGFVAPVGAFSNASGKRRAHPGHAQTAPPPPPEQPASKKARGNEVAAAKPMNEAKKSAKPPTGKAPTAPAKAPAKPKTYPSALVAVLTRHGLLSRAALALEVSKLGFSNAQALKKALTKTQSDGLVEMSSASYQLGAAALDALDPTDAEAYKTVLDHALAARNEKVEQKNAIKERADFAHQQRVRAAGGLTWQARQDQLGLEPRSGFGSFKAI